MYIGDELIRSTGRNKEGIQNRTNRPRGGGGLEGRGGRYIEIYAYFSATLYSSLNYHTRV